MGQAPPACKDERIIYITTRSPDGRGRAGCGFVVDSRHFLTAIHLLAPGKLRQASTVDLTTIDVRFGDGQQAEVVWPLEATGHSLDVVLLRRTDGEFSDSFNLSERWDDKARSWSLAYPDGAPVWIHFAARCGGDSDGNDVIHLETEADLPAASEYWGGASGSAVVVDGRASAIIIQRVPKWLRYLKVLTVRTLMADDEWKDHLRPFLVGDDEDFVARLKKIADRRGGEIIEEFSDSKVDRPSGDDDWRRYLGGAPVADVFERIQESHEALEDSLDAREDRRPDPRTVYDRSSRLVELVCLLAADRAGAIIRTNGDVVRSHTLAGIEFHQARKDGRNVVYITPKSPTDPPVPENVISVGPLDGLKRINASKHVTEKIVDKFSGAGEAAGGLKGWVATVREQGGKSAVHPYVVVDVKPSTAHSIEIDDKFEDIPVVRRHTVSADESPDERSLVMFVVRCLCRHEVVKSRTGN